MKKYIRTKNGIYEYVGYDNECAIPSPIIKCKGKLTHCLECDIIHEADTIEKLCDGVVLAGIDFIFLNKEHTQFRFKGKDEWLDITEYELKRGIYGAIWTDKGLIYVAKMNDKGELELL